jgi:hypothetical protein
MSLNPFSINGRGSGAETVRATVAGCLLLLVLSSAAFADHIHHLWYNNSTWQNVDLTELVGSPVTQGYLTAFATTPNNQFHIFYPGDINCDNDYSCDLHQLYYNGKTWADQDLTSNLHLSVKVALLTPLSGFSIGNQQYVFWSDDYGDIHETYYNNSSWQDQDLTSLNGGPGGISSLAFTTQPDNQIHVYYVGNDNDLYQFYFNGTFWQNQNLTTMISGGPTCTDLISGFAVGNEQHLFCAGYLAGGSYENQELLHIYYNNASWVYDGVILNGGLQPSLGAGIGALQVPNTNQFDVYTWLSNQHFVEYADNAEDWSLYDLTSLIGAPTPYNDDFDGVVAFVTSPNNQIHVYYVPNKNVYQLYWNGTHWSVQDLTVGGGNADWNAGYIAGFPIGNDQHLFYMDDQW